MISDFLPPAITVTTGVGVGRQGKQPTTGCVCPRSKSVIAAVSPGSEAQTQTPAQHSREICERPSSVGWRWSVSVFAQSSEHSSDSGRRPGPSKLGALQLGRWKLFPRPSFIVPEMEEEDEAWWSDLPWPRSTSYTQTTRYTLSLSGATKISRYLIRAKWDREEGGEEGAVRCGP